MHNANTNIKIRKLKNEPTLNRTDDNKLYLLGAYQIGGGIYGAILTLFNIGGFTSYPIGKTLITLFGTVLFLFSVYCGYLLVTRRFSMGLNLSVYNNALQIIGVGAAGYHFQFVSGFFAGITMDLTDDIFVGFGFDFSIITLAFGSSSPSIFMTLNIFAILVLSFILNMKDKIEKVYHSAQNSTVGKSTMHNIG